MKKKKSIIVLAIVLLIIISATLIFLKLSRTPGASEPIVGRATTASQGSNATTSSSTASPRQYQSIRSYEYHVNLPNALMLVDSRGRRTGKDPATGVFYHEIPGTGYGEGDRSGQLGVSGLPDGQYTLYVLGGQTGSYWIDAYPPQKVTGNITAKTMDAYTLNFSSTSMDNPKLIFQSAALSTLSITSVLPHNLPL